MAEIRKHRPQTTAIGDLVRATVDKDAVRPNEPGSARMPEDFDPFFSEEPTEPTTSAAAASAAAGISASGWFTFSPASVQPAEEADDECSARAQPCLPLSSLDMSRRPASARSMSSASASQGSTTAGSPSVVGSSR